MSESSNIKIPEEKRIENTFLDYVRRMPDSAGRRFILIHVKEHGLSAFEAFWDKIRAVAYERHSHEVELTPEECHSLAQAIAPGKLTRRKWVGTAIGSAVAFFGGTELVGRIIDYNIDYNKESNVKKRQNKDLLDNFADNVVEDTEFVFGKLSLPALLLGAGSTGVLVMHELHDLSLKNLVEGKDGPAHIKELVQAMDTIFLPVEVALAENVVRDQKPGNSSRMR